MFQVWRNNFRKDNVFKPIKFIKSAVGFIFPSKCLNCNGWLDPEDKELNNIFSCFCKTCLKKGYELFKPPFCSKCGVSFETEFLENHLCEQCIKNPSRIHRVRAAFEYDKLIKTGIHRYKYDNKLMAAKSFETILFKTFETYFLNSDIDIIVPVPLHIKKMRQRGFNQSYVLIKNFKKLYMEKYDNIPKWIIDPFILERVKQTEPQTGFNFEQRQQNLKNAFAVLKPERIKGKRILLVDDVYTTGATSKEAARILAKSGASLIDVLVLARS